MQAKMEQKLTEKQSKQSQDKDKTGSLLKGGSFIAIIIAITPYLFYLYENVPETRVWNILLFSYNSGINENANVAMWILTGKAIPLLLLFIWFFTCSHWWYHALLVPICMFVYQIISFILSENGLFDEYQLIYLLPIMAVVIPSIYLIRAQIFNKINDANKSMQELEDEFKVSP